MIFFNISIEVLFKDNISITKSTLKKMKKQLLSEEFTRMQKLAGIITEGKSFTPEDNINFKWKNQPLNPESMLTDTESGEEFTKEEFWESDIIGTDPLNYLGLATMETLGKRAGTIAAPAAAQTTGILGAAKRFATLKNVGEAVPGKLNTALRLGLSPRVIAGASRFLGIPGLIASTGYSLYDYLSNKESE
jgi:hypothetical protein